ncbi:MAG TPA: AAA family ATPase [Candidatus Sulfotelmatobacter sp.]|nr:AAA family ATPase [Candidatus Sulfotelmatobacter sp.]
MSLLIEEVAASGYRSLRRIRFPVGRLSVFLGANGVGKTNLYRALQLLQAAAAGGLSQELAAEGGMESALWAGKRREKDLVRVSLAAHFRAETDGATGVRPRGADYSYEVEIGLRHPTAAAFPLEAQVKEESLSFHGGRRPVKLLERRGSAASVRDEAGARLDLAGDLLASETALGMLNDQARFPALHQVRRTMLDWRFFHDIRTDSLSLLRQPCLAVTSPTLASDGSNLAAVFATLAHIRQDTRDLDRAIEDAFPGARLEVPVPGRHATFGMVFPDHPKRCFAAGELSDGTLRYLALAGALLAYRLPAFIALNEPETSLHPDLLAPLARMIVRAADRSQVWLVTHSETLAAALATHGGIEPRIVVKQDGATWIEGLRLTGDFTAED